VLKAQGEYGQAQRLYEESLAVSRELGGEEGIAASLCELGSALLSRGNYQRAGNVFRESLSLWQEIGNTGHIVDCLVGLGRVAGAAGSWESAIKAARLLGAASLLLDTIGSPMQPSDRAEYDHDVAAVRAQLDEAVFVVAWAEGRAMTREQAITFALEV
jgi:tetratricopeptide (TPR) repeat protein